MAGGIDWFRWHHGSVTDQKFGLIGKKARASVAEVIAVWACLLESASAAEDRGALGEVDFESMDFALGMDEGKAERIYTAMVERNLIDDAGVVTRWQQRQPKRERVDEESGNSSKRTREYRQRLKQQGLPLDGDGSTVTPSDATERQVTPSDATERQVTHRGEESREQKRQESKGETEVVAAASASPSQAEPPPHPSAASPKTGSTVQRAPRATRLPAEFQVPDEWRQWAADQFPAWPSGAIDLEASKFADHWHAVPGKDGLKLDWAGTWRNWCRNAKSPGPLRQHSVQSVAAEAARQMGFTSTQPDVIDA